jgi:hypothetical protein
VLRRPVESAQYTSIAYTERLAVAGAAPSVGTVGDAYDNALAEFVLADTLRHEHPHWRGLTPPSPLLAEIKALTRDRDRLQQTQQATESQLRAILEAYHPAPTRLFSSVDRQITLHFVLDYQPRRRHHGSRPPA